MIVNTNDNNINDNTNIIHEFIIIVNLDSFFFSLKKKSKSWISFLELESELHSIWASISTIFSRDPIDRLYRF